MGDRDHYLHGADDVRSAANTMSSAADAMRSAASTVSDAADRVRQANYEHEAWMSQWLDRLEAIVERMPGAQPKPGFMMEPPRVVDDRTDHTGLKL